MWAAKHDVEPCVKSRVSSTFSFPNPVNEYAVRTVAGVVASLAVLAIVLDARWLVVVIAAGFATRVSSGPRIDPLAWLTTKLIIPALGNPFRPAPGPSNRFAQSIGLLLSTISAILVLTGQPVVGFIVLGVLAFVAAIQSALGFCLGCYIFRYLMAWGMIPATVCEACEWGVQDGIHS